MSRLKTLTFCASSGRTAHRTPLSHVEFYREEFVKLQECLQDQREFFSESAISDAERALMQALASVDQLCDQQDADHLISGLLKKFDVLARLSAWSDPRQIH